MALSAVPALNCI